MQTKGGLSSWKYSSAFEMVELSVDCMNKSFAEQFESESNMILDNVLREVRVICGDRGTTSLTSILRLKRFVMFTGERTSKTGYTREQSAAND